MELFDRLVRGHALLTSSAPENDAFEHYMLRALVLAYVGLLRKGEHYVCSAAVVKWYLANAERLNLSIPQLEAHRGEGGDTELPPVISVKLPLETILANRTAAPAPSALQRRLDWVCATLELDDRSALILGILFRLTYMASYRSFSALLNTDRRFADEFGIGVPSSGGGCLEDGEVSGGMVCALLGIPKWVINDYLGKNAPLRRFGLVEDQYGGAFTPSGMLADLLKKDTDDPRLLEQGLFGQPRPSTLERLDFRHLGRVVDDVANILNGAFTTRETGINILFHGDPGTGKTEFATLLGTLCNARVVFAGEANERLQEPSRADRLAHLSFLSALGQSAGRTIVVVDEADDIFVGVDTGNGSDRRGSKVFLSRLIETSAVPTIWITNHPRRLGEAVLRRMARVVEFRQPGVVVRRVIIDRHIAGLDFSLDPASRDRLAQVPVAPAVIASALKAARLGTAGAGGENNHAEAGEIAVASALSIHKALGGRETALPLPHGARFDASLPSADIDLASLEERVTAAGPGALSFLFIGLPGTGKSAFARHLAERLGLEVLEKRGSDLLGMYVGQTEANIAEAFHEAIDNRMFLIFDEADSLLADRSSTVRNWEVSQVNEMLTWMERHPLPFAATSNTPERLDPAMQRRFLFKARFGAMTPAQIAKAFRLNFGCAAPAGVLRLDPLTPGDVTVVARKAKVLRVSDARTLGEMLKEEVALKPGACRPIGFR
ncbi:AAA family ATPase [Pseudochelatococcus lubricantis]|uniref:AAA family ATPase n=1 Tax=Pseudochelatococcus lubricantis TaxID=1538102 RepID=UPI0035E4C997